MRRSKGHAQSVIKTGDLIVNLDAKTVEVDGQRVHLTGKEYQMLELLSLRKGTTLTKEMFLNHLYGGMDEPELKIIDVFICKLRKKLANATDGQQLHRDRLGPRLRAARAARESKSAFPPDHGFYREPKAPPPDWTPPQMAGFLFVGEFLSWGLNGRRPCADTRVCATRAGRDRPVGARTRSGAPLMILQSLAGLPAFLVYFCTGVVAVMAYLFVYTRVTPHNEFQLIRDNDPAAAIALGLSLLGFVLPVVSAIAHSANVVGLPDLERDRADRPDRGLFHRQDSGAEPVGADRGRRNGVRDLARAVVARRRRAQRRLDDLPDHGRTSPPNRNSASAGPMRAATGRCRPKRSGHVALLLMGTRRGRRRRLCADAAQ